jgi:hypothetical protein
MIFLDIGVLFYPGTYLRAGETSASLSSPRSAGARRSIVIVRDESDDVASRVGLNARKGWDGNLELTTKQQRRRMVDKTAQGRARCAH